MKTNTIQSILTIILLSLFLSACAGEVNGAPEPQAASANTIAAGRRSIASYGCGTCHTIPGVPGANGTVGPRLDQFYKQRYIAGQLPNTEANLIKWIQNPQQIDPGDGMPNLGVSEKDARDIVAYLYHQQNILDWLRR